MTDFPNWKKLSGGSDPFPDNWKSPVVAASTATDGNIPLNFFDPFIIDDYSVQVGDRIWLGFQDPVDGDVHASPQNGIYKLTRFGLVRTSDAYTWKELRGARFSVLNGTKYGNHDFRVLMAQTGTIDVDPIDWQDLGTGLYNFNPDQFTVDGSNVSIKTAGITTPLLATGAATVDKGGTGITNYVIGDIPYASASQVMQKITAVPDGSVLSSAGVNTAPKYKTLLGTANQVVVTSNANDFTFSLEQDLNTTSSPTFNLITLSGASPLQLLATDSLKKMQTLSTDTYPSLDEIAFVKGVTSSIQSQIDGKQPSGSYITALTGDVVASGPGSAAATISNGAVGLAKMSNLPANTIIGNDTNGSSIPLALTKGQVINFIQPTVVIDSGSSVTIDNTKYTVILTNSSPRTVSITALPSHTITIKDGAFNAASANITISATGGVLIDNEANFIMSTDGQAASFITDGVNLFSV